jgi:hypothetical protein
VRGEVLLSLYYSEAISSVSALMKLQAQYVDFLTVRIELFISKLASYC